MKKMIFKIQIEGLKSAVEDLSLLSLEDLNTLEQQIENLKQQYMSDSKIVEESTEESILKSLHHLLFEVHVIEGALVCPETGRRFLIKESE
jgi:hypothetical protein